MDIPFQDTEHMIFKVLPASHTRMILFFGEPSLQQHSGSLEKVDRYSLTGFCTRSHHFIPTQAVRQVMIHFSPLGVQPFIDFPLSDITDSRAELKHVFHHDADHLCERLTEAVDLAQQKRVLDQFFLNQVRQGKEIDQRAKSIVQMITATNGSLRLESLGQEIFSSTRTIQRIVHTSIGVNYKTYAGLVRMEYVRHLMQQRRYTLTEIAMMAGYHDQAHFVHDFQHNLGESPSAFLAKHSQMVWQHVESPERRAGASTMMG